MTRPPFLNALDHPLEVAPGEWVTDCPACELRSRGTEHGLIHVHQHDGWWRLDCDTCNHHTVADYLQLSQHQLRAGYDTWADHTWKAIMLAPNLETCRALLNNEHVPGNRLDPLWARRFGIRTAA